jgi:2-polyprenyl-6-methoxyphenol hydroxylase-like FAD-dependent oxidoreductase
MKTLASLRVLVVGGGFAGMSAAIELRKLGAEVDLCEIDPGWRSYEEGISLGGATLRAFRQLGILEAFLREGSASDGVELHLSDGTRIATLPTPRLAGPDVAGSGAIMRPVLARLLADATRASGSRIHLGCTVSEVKQDAEGVEVRLDDDRYRRYDLVIAADGVHSAMRNLLFPRAARPTYCVQAVWRAALPRMDEVKTTMMWLGPVKVGLNPVSASQMYLFAAERRPSNERVDAATFADRLRALLADFGAPLLQRVRESIGAQSQIVFRPMEGLLMSRPWHLGRVVLIGDAVHAATPHLASGVCIAIEDALVLAEELGRRGDVPSALQAFEDRRWERCRMVVENSGRLCQIEIEGGSMDEHARIMRDSLMALAQPI